MDKNSLFSSVNSDRSDIMVGEGRFIVERMLQGGVDMISIVCEHKYTEHWKKEAGMRCPVVGVDEQALKEHAGYPFHRGVLATARKPAKTMFDRTVAQNCKSLLVLPALGDPDNFGTILRTAACFRIDAVLVGPGCPDPYSRRILRKSMGHNLFLPLFFWDKNNLPLSYLLENEYSIFTADCDLSAPLYSGFRPCEKTALVMGHESQGLPLWSQGIQPVRIAMNARADSLNVAIACGILLNHFFPCE